MSSFTLHSLFFLLLLSVPTAGAVMHLKTCRCYCSVFPERANGESNKHWYVISLTCSGHFESSLSCLPFLLHPFFLCFFKTLMWPFTFSIWVVGQPPLFHCFLSPLLHRTKCSLQKNSANSEHVLTWPKLRRNAVLLNPWLLACLYTCTAPLCLSNSITPY